VDKRASSWRLGAIAIAISLILAAAIPLVSSIPSASAAEPFFPHAGNLGYDAAHYDLHLAYRPSRNYIKATERFTATSRQALRSFSLDLDGLKVTSVKVGGERATISRGKGKLKVRPAVAIPAKSTFTAVIAYQGRPEVVTDPDGSPEGWYPTPDGAIGVGEPQGTAAWLACNNVPTDKASFDIAITAPAGLKGVSNGRLLGVHRMGATKTWEWSESEPMATYLAVVDIGRGVLTRGKIGNLPTWTFVDTSQVKHSSRSLAQLPTIINFETKYFGPYPFDTAGSIVDPAELGYALETQGRPIYAFAPDRTTVVHETAHQWFGDSVGLTTWPEIWLNEGFAAWSEWFYAEHHGGLSALATFRRLYKTPAAATRFWNPPSGHPGQAKNLFGTSTYVRGGMALEALRVKIGTPDLVRLLRRWTKAHRYGNATIREFIAMAEEVSGKNLKRLFDDWLFERGKPRGYGSL
jgi:aminopeptidase N